MLFFTHTPGAADTARAVVETFATWKHSGAENIAIGNGMNVTAVGIVVVFTALAIMSGTIFYLARLSQRWSSRRKDIPAGTSARATTSSGVARGISGEMIAAIAFALDRHVNQYHDDEEAVLTIKKVSRPYSPWSSKLHSITRPPFRIQSKA